MLAKEKFEIFPTCSPLLKPARLLIFTNISSLLTYYILLTNFSNPFGNIGAYLGKIILQIKSPSSMIEACSLILAL